MSEDFTALAVAYLLGELDPDARARFEAQLASDPALVAELKAITDALATVAESDTPATALPETLRQDMLAEVMRARRQRLLASWLQKSAWPLAAAILLAANVGQWLYHRRPLDRTAEAVRSPSSEPIAVAPAGAPTTGAVPVAAKASPSSPAPRNAAPGPSIRRTMTFSISQTTVSTNAAPPAPREKLPPQHGALELRQLPRVAESHVLYLWARPAGADHYEPVGEVPRPLYGASGTINYQLRPGAGAAAHFLVTIEPRHHVPAAPSGVIVCAGP